MWDWNCCAHPPFFARVIAASYKKGAPLTIGSQTCIFAIFATGVFLLRVVWRDTDNPFIVNRPGFPVKYAANAFTGKTHSARAISAFWKTHSCKLIPNWTRSRMITYTKSASADGSVGALSSSGTVTRATRDVIQKNIWPWERGWPPQD